MSYLRNSILATIIYYDIFDFPLTAPEVYRYLINPRRLSSLRSDLQNSQGGLRHRPESLLRDKEISRSDFGIMDQIVQDLAGLVDNGQVSHKNGFYFLLGRDVLCELRIERKKIAAQKWKKFLRIAKWFQAVPYLEAVFASGSLAINNTENESDFDVLTAAKSGRLYICRIFLSFTASLFGARRTRYEKIAPDKFCFNHYITDKNLNIKHESLFNAQTYINLKPVIASDGIFRRFYTENIWLNKYVYNFKPADDFKGRLCGPKGALCIVAKTLEFILNSPFGDKVESWAKRYQQKRIKNNPATYESGGRVVFNDNELEFHPRSFEAFAIDKYNKKLKQLGIIPYIEEKDSGLNA